MRILADVSEGDVGGVQAGSPVRFTIETLGDHAFSGRVAEVRLDPQVTQAAATSGSGSSTATATSGTSSGSSTAASGTTQATSGGSASQGGSSSTVSAAASPIAATLGVVSYTAVIDVDAVNENIPPGGTALVTLTAGRRPQAVRIPNNALAFSPSNEALAAAHQERPALEHADDARTATKKTQRDYVWKFENSRFVPIAVEVGIADDTWTELVSGDVKPGDRLVTAAGVQR